MKKWLLNRTMKVLLATQILFLEVAQQEMQKTQELEILKINRKKDFNTEIRKVPDGRIQRKKHL